MDIDEAVEEFKRIYNLLLDNKVKNTEGLNMFHELALKVVYDD